jgi:HAD superfamily hydrolase (TIGR01490 family)
MILAFFDADGTLYAGQFGRGLMKYSSDHNRRYFAWRYYASILPAYTLYRIKSGSRENMQYALLANLSGMLQGLDQEEANAALTWLLHDYLIPTLRTDVTKRLKEHQAKGHKVVIVSGMLMQCAEMFREHLGADGAVGTQSEFKNGKFTGRTIPPAVSGTAKVDKIHELVKSKGWDVDWASSYAYGDSFTDRYMMDLVGKPVAVYPDVRLHVLAKEKNWEVLGIPRE